MAAAKNATSAAKILLAAKADLEARNNSGNTPLHEAAQAGSTAMVSLLLDSGASVDATNLIDATPLFLAVSYKSLDATRVLLEHKADPNHNVTYKNQQSNWPVSVAANGSDNEILKLLLDAGANPEPHSPQNYGPLIMAIGRNDADGVQLLLQHGADPNRRSPDGNSPLDYILKNRLDARMVSLLLDKGADPNAKDSSGLSPLFNTTDPQIGRLLVEHKADVNARLDDGKTQIMRTYAYDTNYLKFLLDAGAKPDLQDTNGDTALHHAIYDSQPPEFVAILLEHKANPNIQDNNGLTPLDVANARVAEPNRYPMGGIPGIPRQRTISTEDEKKIADLLVKAGGLANLPKRDRIEVRRASESGTTYTKGSHDWNRFSLLELVAGNYGLLSRNTSGEWSIEESWGSSLWNSYLRFPDFKNLVIYRRVDNSTKQTAINVNLEEILNTGDCSRDVGLLWGDIVEIPEADHPVDQRWEGLSDQQVASLIKCVSRQVTVRIKGESTTLKLAPELDALTSPSRPNGRWKLVRPSFMLRSVLDNSKLIRVSSDLSRVKVTRHDPVTKKTVEWTVDCTDPNQADLWLRDGDVIEVPEK
jgi:ankyrin repeat protein